MKKSTLTSLSCLIFVVACLLAQTLSAQKPNSHFIDPREAEEHFNHHNYLSAMSVYKELLKRDPDDADYNLKVALCYLRTNLDKKQAIPYLEKLTKKGKTDNENWFYLGQAYQYDNRFDDAIKAYSTFKEKSSKKDVERADRAIETCYNGKQFVKFPMNVTFENLGKDVNSEYADYYPYATKNESFMVFTSRRKGGKSSAKEMDGLFPSDIYLTTIKDGNWIKAANIGGPVNTSFDEQAVGLSPDGSSMTVYIDHIDSLGNIYISNYQNGKFQKLVKLNESVNAGFESSGCVSDDGQFIFFASERPGGMGGTDIYLSKKLPSGQWAIPQNLGKVVNTPYNEDFPHFSEDGKTLYFASQGHTGMGGYDIFKSVYNNETNTWTEPKNLGYPINTSDDNYTISFTEKERSAYVSINREGGMGDLDIWRLRFNDSDQRYTIVSGRVRSSDTLAKKIEVIVTATNLATREDFHFVPIATSGKFVMALEPGKYEVSIEGKGFLTYKETIVILDKGSFQPEIKKDYQLTKSP